jgi:hypothetical protein
MERDLTLILYDFALSVQHLTTLTITKNARGAVRTIHRPVDRSTVPPSLTPKGVQEISTKHVRYILYLQDLQDLQDPPNTPPEPRGAVRPAQLPIGTSHILSVPIPSG